MQLSIIIVNWNSKDYLRNCLISVLKNTRGIAYEIIVIDSASYDGCGEMLRRHFPQVRFIQSDRNLGFAKANNEAFRTSKGKNLLFLNPDTEINDNVIPDLMKVLESTSGAGAVGARLLNSDGSTQISCIRAFPTVLNQILDTNLLRRQFPLSKMWGMASLFEKSDVVREVDAISGACLMIKREVFKEVGNFSEDYFMYSEDIDLCHKIWRNGWKAFYFSGAKVIHHGGKSSSETTTSSFTDVLLLESRFRFFCKTRSHDYGQLYRLSMFYVSLLRIWLVSLYWSFMSVSGKASSSTATLRKWIARLRWTLGRENSLSQL